MRLNDLSDIKNLNLCFLGNQELFHSLNWYSSYRYWSKLFFKS